MLLKTTIIYSLTEWVYEGLIINIFFIQTIQALAVLLKIFQINTFKNNLLGRIMKYSKLKHLKITYRYERKQEYVRVRAEIQPLNPTLFTVKYGELCTHRGTQLLSLNVSTPLDAFIVCAYFTFI